MYEIIGFIGCVAMALASITDDTIFNSVSDNDYIQIKTFEDYGGDIVPYVSDPYIEDNISNDVVEEITVNQTLVDNTEVLERMDKLDSKLTLLNNSFNSVLSSDISSDDSYITFEESDYLINQNCVCAIMSGKTFYNIGAPFYMRAFDVSDKNTLLIDWEDHNLQYVICGTNIPPCEIPTRVMLDFTDVCPIAHNIYTNELGYVSSMVEEIDVSNYDYVVFNVACGDDMFFPSVRYPRNSSSTSVSDNDPSVSVTYPQEVIDNVSAMQKQLVTLTGVTLLNLIIPMFVSVFKRMTDPFKKRRDE